MRSSIPASVSPGAKWSTATSLLGALVLFIPLLSGQAQPPANAPITFELQVVQAERQKPSFERKPRAPRYAPPRANLLRPNFRAKVTATAAFVD